MPIVVTPCQPSSARHAKAPASSARRRDSRGTFGARVTGGSSSNPRRAPPPTLVATGASAPIVPLDSPLNAGRDAHRGRRLPRPQPRDPRRLPPALGGRPRDVRRAQRLARHDRRQPEAARLRRDLRDPATRAARSSAPRARTRYKIEGGVEGVKRTFEQLDALVAIGGEDTLGVAARLSAEESLAGRRRPEDDRQRPERHRLHVRLRHRRRGRDRGDRPLPLDGRVAQPDHRRRDDGPPRRLDRALHAASPAAPTTSSSPSSRSSTTTSPPPSSGARARGKNFSVIVASEGCRAAGRRRRGRGRRLRPRPRREPRRRRDRRAGDRGAHRHAGARDRARLHPARRLARPRATACSASASASRRPTSSQAGNWGQMAALHGDDVVSVPLTEATAELKLVPRRVVRDREDLLRLTARRPTLTGSGQRRSGVAPEGIAPPGDAASPTVNGRRVRGGRALAAARRVELPLWRSGSGSALALAALTTRIVDWFVMTDELLYERLALSVVQLGSPLPHVHGELIANAEPALPAAARAALRGTARARRRSHHAHVAERVGDGSACIPAFLLARRVTGSRLAAYARRAAHGLPPVDLLFVASCSPRSSAIRRSSGRSSRSSARRGAVAPNRRAAAARARASRSSRARSSSCCSPSSPVAFFLHELALVGPDGPPARPDGARCRTVARRRVLAWMYAVVIAAAVVLAATGRLVQAFGTYALGGRRETCCRAAPPARCSSTSPTLALGLGILPFVVGDGVARSRTLVRPARDERARVRRRRLRDARRRARSR